LPSSPSFELRGITKRFGAVLANDAVDLSAGTGEILGLVGENGAGKSTLMEVLYGMHRADAGEIRVGGERRQFRSPLDAIAAGLGMVHQHFMLFPSLTVAENVVFGAEPARRGVLQRESAVATVAELAARYGLEVEPRARVASLPVGVRQRVEILKALYRGARILILDEPTAVLTPSEREELLEVLRRLAAQGATIVFITHKLPEVMSLCHRATVLRDGRVAGSVPVAETTADELSRMMVGREIEAVTRSSEREPGETALEVESLAVVGDDGRPRVADLSVDVRAGEVVGVAGAAGNGQSELAEAIAGLRSVRSGRIEIGATEITDLPIRARRAAGLAHVPDDRDGTGLALEATVEENLLMGFEERPAFSRRGLLRRSAIRRWASEAAERYQVKLGDLGHIAGSLSGGNRQKLVVGRELAHEARVLLVEQPTRGVDVGSIQLIHRELLEYAAAGGAILLISAELSELRALCDRIVVMLGGRVVGELAREAASEEALGRLMAGAG
jgi:simple sugar transport system ATP-binding protein